MGPVPSTTLVDSPTLLPEVITIKTEPDLCWTEEEPSMCERFDDEVGGGGGMICVNSYGSNRGIMQNGEIRRPTDWGVFTVSRHNTDPPRRGDFGEQRLGEIVHHASDDEDEGEFGASRNRSYSETEQDPEATPSTPFGSKRCRDEALANRIDELRMQKRVKVDC